MRGANPVKTAASTQKSWNVRIVRQGEERGSCGEPTRLCAGWIARKPFRRLARRACILVALRAIVASFAVHASVAAGLVAAGRGGHATPGTPVTTTVEVLEIDTSTETVEAPVPVAEPP